MALGRFDGGAAAERTTELERRALRFYAAVSRGRVLSALDRGDKAIPRSMSGAEGGSMEQVTVTTPWSKTR